jgi:hypothetical protein
MTFSDEMAGDRADNRSMDAAFRKDRSANCE